MKIKLVKIGPIKSKEIKTLSEDYIRRLQVYTKIEVSCIKDQNFNTLKKEDSGRVFLLDQYGDKYSSEEFAELLKNLQDNPTIKVVTLVIGGAYGFSEEMKKRADGIISFSDMVFPNELAWLILCEQTYRALSIMAGSKYHHI